MNLLQRLATASLILLPLSIGCEQEPQTPKIRFAPALPDIKQTIPLKKLTNQPQNTTTSPIIPAEDRCAYELKSEDFTYAPTVAEKIKKIKENPERSIDSLSENTKKEYDEFISGKRSNVPYYALTHNPPTNNTDIVLRNGFQDPETKGMIENQVIVTGIVYGNLLDELATEYRDNLPGHTMNLENPSKTDQLLMFFYENFRADEKFGQHHISSNIPILTIPFNIEIKRPGQSPIPIKYFETTLEIQPYKLRFEPEGVGDKFEKRLYDFHDARKAGVFWLNKSNKSVERDNASQYVTNYTIDNWTGFEHKNWRRYTPRGQDEIKSAFVTDRKELTGRWGTDIKRGVIEFMETDSFRENITSKSY